MGFLSRKKRGIAAASDVDAWRAAAEKLRASDPGLYGTLLSQAGGSAVEEAAGRDPDAFVALTLAELEKAGVISGYDGVAGSGETVTGDLQPGWSESEVVEVIAVIEPLLTEFAMNPDGVPLVYPSWAMRTWLKGELALVLDVAADVTGHPGGGLNEETHEAAEAAYDRAFALNGLTPLVDEVIRRVLLGGADAEAYAKSVQAESREEGQSPDLRECVERWLPEEGEAEEPQWTILAMPVNPAAPTITISRDPRSGPRLTPVFFVGVADEEALLSVGSGLYEGTGHIANMSHMAFVEPGRGFLIIPAMYHLVDVQDFTRITRDYLESQALGGMEVIEECCEVLINRGDDSYKAVRGAGGGIEVLAVGSNTIDDDDLGATGDAEVVAASVANPRSGSPAGESIVLSPHPPAEYMRAIGENGFTTLLATGIVNPFGPTLNVVGVDGDIDAEQPLPVIRMMLNPVVQEFSQVGIALLDSSKMEAHDFSKLIPVIADGSCPTLLLPSSLLDPSQALVVHAELFTAFADGSTVLDGVRRNPGDPWTRVQETVDAAMNLFETYPDVPAERSLTPDEATELAEYLLDPDNLALELQAFVTAWKGAIDFAGTAEADGTLSIEGFAEYLALVTRTCNVPGL